MIKRSARYARPLKFVDDGDRINHEPKANGSTKRSSVDTDTDDEHVERDPPADALLHDSKFAAGSLKLTDYSIPAR
ncbi:unnamed protein product [Peronospora belbahrii]|uniref:Uncharacterized protein n=1 Tax=Peronospora belbahrii TaxID=622444 RepID=A0ABN8CMU7_9STRA|nr:unnamed protein product [Peronospora belbahrii]